MPYAYQASVSIPAATTNNQTNFSVAITGTDVKLKTVANGGAVQNTVVRTGQTVPADLIVSSDSAGLSLYNWGFDFYDPLNGIATIWILLPTHFSSSATTVYISVGNVSVSTFLGGSVGAEFDSNTKVVYHFNETSLGTGSTSYDSSSSGNNLTTSATASASSSVAGKIGKALQLPNTSQYNGASAISAAVSGIGTGNHFTVTAWINFISTTTMDAANEAIITSAGAYPYNNFGIATNSTSALILTGVTNNVDTAHLSGNTSTLSTGTWYLIVVTYDAATLKIYMNGALANSADGVWTRSADAKININNAPADIGGRFSSAIYDEIRFSATDRDLSWIATEYANQSSIPAMGSFSPISSGFTSRLSLLGAG